VLGLKDALVELTGALAGFTFVLQNTCLIALAGLSLGVAALTFAIGFLIRKTLGIEVWSSRQVLEGRSRSGSGEQDCLLRGGAGCICAFASPIFGLYSSETDEAVDHRRQRFCRK
jgi:VIT1/CCC1 family predicted Fe2+/Mn2+ transporter